MYETYDRDIKRMSTSPEAIWAGRRLGIIGGGQLAKMTSMAALRLGCEVTVLERNNFSPAAATSSFRLVGDWNEADALMRLADQVDALTVENEFIEDGALDGLEKTGVALYPTPATLRLVQDKLLQKTKLRAAGLPVPEFRDAPTPADVLEAAGAWGWPVLLKTRRNGYDGKGNATLRDAAALEGAWRRLTARGAGLYVEQFCPFQRELAVMVTRGRDGRMVVYPVVETRQADHVCKLVQAPAEIPDAVAAKAREMALRAAEAFGMIGSMGVELFLLDGEALAVNELAPRVHNSGHYTIEACACSQFENHVRAVLGWPLGDPRMIVPSAAMVNLLGHQQAPAHVHGLASALSVPGATVHLYGKVMTGPGRKMGHVTTVGDNLQDAVRRAEQAASFLSFGGQT